MNNTIKAAIIGGSGFTGLELIKILSNHRYVEISVVTSNTYKGMDVSDAFPSFNYGANPCYKKNLLFKSMEGIDEESLKKVDVVFLCLPPLESMSFVKKCLLGFKGVIIDIGSDFRINEPGDFKFWYGKEHALKNIMPEFVYGLPEVYRDTIKKSRRVANPGCYPTSVILALAPLLMNPGFAIENIIIDSKSGVSGAGRKLKNEYLYCALNENFFAYSAILHRHTGEIEQELKNLSGSDLKVCFTPHILPVNRGIFTSIYCTVSHEGKEDLLINEINNAYKKQYEDCIFIRFLGERIPQLKDVTGTNNCQIGIVFDGRSKILKIFCTIDNLLKGAAGQAVQNMNLIFNFNEEEALDGYGVFS